MAGRDLPGAARHFGEAARLNPDSAEACFNLGTAYAQLSRYAEAAEYFTRAVERDPSSRAYWGAAATSLRPLLEANRGDILRPLEERLRRLNRPPPGPAAAPAAP
jgi:tetratricopeptide (TPR) repeat protein